MEFKVNEYIYKMKKTQTTNQTLPGKIQVVCCQVVATDGLEMYMHMRVLSLTHTHTPSGNLKDA